MNFWIISIYFWLLPFSPSERVALFAALLVFIGVVGEEVADLDPFEDESKAKLKDAIKRASIGVLLLGLAGDVLGIVMGQAEMTALTREAGDAKKSAQEASVAAANAIRDSAIAGLAAGDAIKEAGVADTTAHSASRKIEALKPDVDNAKRAIDSLHEQAQRVRSDTERLARMHLARYIDFAMLTDDLSKAIARGAPKQSLEIVYVDNSEAKELAKSLCEHSPWPVLKCRPLDDSDDIPSGFAVASSGVKWRMRTPEEWAARDSMFVGSGVALVLDSFSTERVFPLQGALYNAMSLVFPPPAVLDKRMPKNTIKVVIGKHP